MLLNELFDFLPKSNKPASYGKSEGKYPFFNSSNIIDKSVDDPDYSGEFLIIGDGGTGNCKYYNGKFSATDHTYLLKPKNNTNCKLVKYFLEKDNYKILNDGFKGVGIKNVSKSYIQNIEFKKNNKYTDQFILDVLDSINILLQENENQLVLLDELIKSRFIEMFGEKFEGEKIKLSKISNPIIGLTYRPDNVCDDGTIVLRSGNIQNNELQIVDDVIRVTGVKINDNKYIQDKDILMCSRNGSARLVGKSCLIRNPQEKMTFGAFMTVIRTNYPYFLQSFFTSQYFKEQLTGVATTSVNQITSTMLNNYEVIEPSIEEEIEFASFVELIDKSKFIVQKRIDTYKELLAKKMDEYFN